MIEEYSTHVTRKRNGEDERGNGKKKKKTQKDKERKNFQWTTEPPSCRQAGRSFSASRPPLSHGTWFPSFPFSSFAPYLPSSSSPRVRHFCLCFAVIVDRKRMSAPWKMAAVALPVRERFLSLSLSPLTPRYTPCPASYTQASSPKRVLSDSPLPPRSIFLSFYHCSVRLWPSTRARTIWRDALHVFLTSQTKRFIIAPLERASASMCVYVFKSCPVAHVII